MARTAVKAQAVSGADTYVIATPAALEFLDVGVLEAQTGHPVRSRYPSPTGKRPVVAPCHCHRGRPGDLQHDQQVGTGNQRHLRPGHRWPRPPAWPSRSIVLPFVKAALAANPDFDHSVTALRRSGVHVRLGPTEWEPQPPGTGGSRIELPRHLTLDAAEKLSITPARTGDQSSV